MRKTKQILIAIALLVLSGEVLAQQNMYYVKSETGLNLRPTAGTSGKAIVLIPAGDKVNVLNQDKDWWQVEYGKQLGYVHSKQLTKDPNQAAIARKIWDKKHEAPTSGPNESANPEPDLSKHVTDYEWGIGVRAGDPMGLTIKKYIGTNALELMVGSLPFDNNGLSLYVHYLYHLPAQKIGNWNNIQGLDWYFGAGGQLKRFNENVDIGADGTIGAEYLFQNIPISIFADIILYLEIVNNPFNIDLDAGLGARYNF